MFPVEKRDPFADVPVIVDGGVYVIRVEVGLTSVVAVTLIPTEGGLHVTSNLDGKNIILVGQLKDCETIFKVAVV